MFRGRYRGFDGRRPEGFNAGLFRRWQAGSLAANAYFWQKKLRSMKALLPFVLVAVVLACRPMRPAAPLTTAFESQPVWADEFDRDGLPDPTRWSYATGGHGWGNNELQFYTKDRPENARVENGRLIIEARKEDFQGKNYTSARLLTKGKGDWTYGRVVVRARLPAGRGTWPAIWMLASGSAYSPNAWPDNGEIDIMEEVGYEPNVIHASIHTKAFNHVIGTHKTATVYIPTAQSGFHDYRLDWTPETITAFVDDKPYATFNNTHGGWTEWPFDKPQYLLLNLAVGGNWGGQKGIDDSIFPQSMEVDFVRIYALRK